MEQSKPLVTVVVPHHLNENDEYLKWCLHSINQSINVDLEVICISDAVTCPNVPDNVLLIHDQTLTNLTKKWHHGVKMASPHSKYVMLISDDVMVSKHTISEMAFSIGDGNAIMGPASNCDATTRYHTQFKLTTRRPYDGTGIQGQHTPICETITVGLKSSLEEIKRFEQEVIDYPKLHPIFIDPGWISFYCTMFPKSVLKAVGDFDERLDCRFNDVDYCNRARNLGIPSLIHLGVFALHFGDRTLPKCTSAAEYLSADKAWLEKCAGTPQDDGDLL